MFFLCVVLQGQSRSKEAGLYPHPGCFAANELAFDQACSLIYTGWRAFEESFRNRLDQSVG